MNSHEFDIPTGDFKATFETEGRLSYLLELLAGSYDWFELNWIERPSGALPDGQKFTDEEYQTILNAIYLGEKYLPDLEKMVVKYNQYVIEYILES